MFKVVLVAILLSLSSFAKDITFLSYNTWLLPEIFFTAHRPHARSTAIADYLSSSDFEVIALQEVFTRKPFNRINQKMKAAGYYSTGKPDINFPKILNSGLVTYSKYPIIASIFVGYRSCYGDDCFAGKGLLISKIKVKEDYLYVVNVHLQASRHFKRVRARKKQIKQIAKILKRFNFDAPVVLMGDFNVNKYGDEYQFLIDTLGVLDKPFDGELIYSSDAVLNDHKKRKGHKERQLLDYNFLYNHQDFYYLTLKSKIIRPKGSYKKWRDIDLSDHFAIFSTLSFLQKE